VTCVLLALARVLVGGAFAVHGAWRWAGWEERGHGVVAEAFCWLAGCLELTFGLWLIFGVLLPFTGVCLMANAVWTVLCADHVSHQAGVLALGVAALVLSRRGCRWTFDHFGNRRAGRTRRFPAVVSRGRRRASSWP
jgi:uncharacterized membrane protein YphA (DoxX/SURF4 family)